MKVGRLDINQENILKWLKAIPFFGAVFLVANFYANSGVLSKRKRIATFFDWCKRILIGVLFTLVLSLGVVVPP